MSRRKSVSRFRSVGPHGDFRFINEQKKKNLIGNYCFLQPSWFAQSLLFQLCVEVNKVGAHALPRPTLRELLQACLNQALQQYHSLVQQPRNKVNPKHLMGMNDCSLCIFIRAIPCFSVGAFIAIVLVACYNVIYFSLRAP